MAIDVRLYREIVTSAAVIVGIVHLASALNNFIRTLSPSLTEKRPEQIQHVENIVLALN